MDFGIILYQATVTAGLVREDKGLGKLEEKQAIANDVKTVLVL